ncbi:MAG TPA: hypothetical protein VGH78_05470 [Solirubrobacteraceae bacterium]|jgi:hypothetical protein
MDLTAGIERPPRERLVRAATNAYLSWRRRCTTASDAYRRWADAADACEAERAWRQYETAVSCEKAASRSYVELVEQVATFESASRG